MYDECMYVVYFGATPHGAGVRQGLLRDARVRVGATPTRRARNSN